MYNFFITRTKEACLYLKNSIFISNRNENVKINMKDLIQDLNLQLTIY